MVGPLGYSGAAGMGPPQVVLDAGEARWPRGLPPAGYYPRRPFQQPGVGEPLADIARADGVSRGWVSKFASRARREYELVTSAGGATAGDSGVGAAVPIRVNAHTVTRSGTRAGTAHGTLWGT